MVRKVFASMMIMASVLAAGCNTISGAGQDIKAGGSAIERAADKAK